MRRRVLILGLGLALSSAFMLAGSGCSRVETGSPGKGDEVQPASTPLPVPVPNDVQQVRPAERLALDRTDGRYGLYLNSRKVDVALVVDDDEQPRRDYLVPLRSWGTSLGLGVSWDASEKVAYLGGKAVPQTVLVGVVGYGRIGDLMRLAKLGGIEVVDAARTIIVARSPEGQS